MAIPTKTATSSLSLPPPNDFVSKRLPQAVMKFDLSCNSEDDIRRIITKNDQSDNDSSNYDIYSPYNDPGDASSLFQCDYSTHGIQATDPMSLLETQSTISKLQSHYLAARSSDNENESIANATTSLDQPTTTTVQSGLTLELWLTPAVATSFSTATSRTVVNKNFTATTPLAASSRYGTTQALSSSSSLPIFTIGYHPSGNFNHSSSGMFGPQASSVPSFDDYVGCYGYDLLLAQRRDDDGSKTGGRRTLLEVSYQDNDIAQSCRYLLVPQALVDEISLQVILILSQG